MPSLRLTGASKPTTHDDLLAEASKAPLSHHHPSQHHYMPHHLHYFKGQFQSNPKKKKKWVPQSDVISSNRGNSITRDSWIGPAELASQDITRDTFFNYLSTNKQPNNQTKFTPPEICSKKPHQCPQLKAPRKKFPCADLMRFILQETLSNSSKGSGKNQIHSFNCLFLPHTTGLVI